MASFNILKEQLESFGAQNISLEGDAKYGILSINKGFVEVAGLLFDVDSLAFSKQVAASFYGSSLKVESNAIVS